MKTLTKITFITCFSLAVLTLSGLVKANELPHFTYGDPDILIKVGGNPTEGRRNNTHVVELENGLCDYYKNCYNPFIVYIREADSSNTGVGVDYVYKAFKRPGFDALRLSIGGVKFANAVDGSKTMYLHTGISFEAFASEKLGLLFAFDQYRFDEPVNVFSAGVHLKF